MPVDRQAVLKKAEKLLRQGKLEGAIQEYVRLVEDNPRDWNAMNALGDLYTRAGSADLAVAQFTRIADHLHDEGFFPKAAALYKKALKTQADHEPALLRLAEMATRQGLAADAKLYWNHLAKLRRARGDEAGASHCLVALGALPDADVKLAAGRAAQAVADESAAVTLYEEAAELFERVGRTDEALDALVAAAQLAAADGPLRARAARQCLVRGDLDRARLVLSGDAAGNDPDLLLALARVELAGGRPDDARRALVRLLGVAPARSADVMTLAGDLAAQGNRDAAFGCVDAVVDTALLAGDVDSAVAALHALLRHGAHVPALMKLVEVAVDADRPQILAGAQEQLADAYLEAGRGHEARLVAEDLVSRDPGRAGNVARLRRALVQEGAEDVEGILARYQEPPPPFGDSLSDLDLSAVDDPVDLEYERPGVPLEPAPGAPEPGRANPVDEARPEDARLEDAGAIPEAVVARPLDTGPSSAAPPPEDAGPVGALSVESVEIDLSDAVARLASDPPVFAPPPGVSVPPGEAEPGAGDPEDLERVFARMRVRVREHVGTAPAAQLERGLQRLAEGRASEGIADLEAAARTPMLRFKAALALGRFHAGRGDLGPAVEWLERAADSPGTSDDESLAALYDLANVLERMGERARALAVLLEIDADQGAYRDVPLRIEQLTRERTGSGWR